MSYMDGKNILGEGFFDFLKKLKSYRNLSPAEKKAMRSAKVRKAKKEFDDAAKNLEKKLANF